MLGERRESERAFSGGSCQRLHRASQIEPWQRRARLTEKDGNGRGGKEARTVSWSGSKSKARTASKRESRSGGNKLEAREGNEVATKLPRGLQLDASRQPRSRTAAPLYRAGSLQRYASGTVPPCAILCTLGGSSELLLGHQCPLFLFFPGQFCGAPQLLPQIIIILILT